MLVDVKDYRIFFSLLWEKFKSKEFDDNNPLPAKVTDVWKTKRKNGNYIEYLTRLRFEATPLYFYKLKPPKKVKSGEFEVSDLLLAKALAYIEDEEAQLNKGSKDWEKEANQRWERFKENHATENKPSESSKFYDGIEIDNDLAERIFLDIVTHNEEVFCSRTIQKIVSNFFEAINDKEYEKAWALLSPDAQRKSWWDGNLFIFESSCFNIASIKPTKLTQFKYGFQEIKFSITYKQTGVLYDLTDFLERANANKHKSHSSEDFINVTKEDRALEAINKCISSWKKTPTDANSILEISGTEICSSHFQRYFFSLEEQFPLLKSNYYSKVDFEYDASYTTEFICVFSKNGWRINNVGAFEPSVNRKYISSSEKISVINR